MPKRRFGNAEEQAKRHRWYDRCGLRRSGWRNRLLYYYEPICRTSTHRPVTKACYNCQRSTWSCLSNAIHRDSSAEGAPIMAKSIQESPLSTQSASKADFVEKYQRVRRFTEQLCEPLATEDYVIQSMPDVSPTKWHIAHVTWFWETFLLLPALPGYQSLHPQYAY